LIKILVSSAACLALLSGTLAPGAALAADRDRAAAEARAKAVEAQMTDDERVVLTHGDFAVPVLPGVEVPKEALIGAGYIAGVPRLQIPALYETDATLGVSWVDNMRGDGGATPLPSGLAQAATWNPALIRKGGAIIGAEAKAKGFNVMLAGGANLIREPRNGRAFEYLSEDPLLTGVLAGQAIAGVQSNGVISTVKHFAVNHQETGRSIIDARISDAAARESDLLAFQIAIEQGDPGAVMCSYNKVNGAYACENDYLLNKVLKQDWGFKGFVMSDWGAVHGVDAALKGLDQQSGSQLDKAVFLGGPLKDAAARDPAYAARLKDMNRRILYAIYANGVEPAPPIKRPIDVQAGLAVAQDIAAQGIVLLRNRDNALPLAVGAKRIAVIGDYADTGVPSGGGSSQVQMDGGPAVALLQGGDSPFGVFMQEAYHRSVPLKAVAAKAPDADIRFSRGLYIAEAVAAAKQAEVAIIFATGWRTEGQDVADLSLPRGQDALIAAVAEANPNTIVVLQTGGAVSAPWLNKTAAVLQAWYPGGRGAEAIADVLFGTVNPSGRLPITFPASLDQTPRPKLDGADTIRVDFIGREGSQTLSADYDIEGSDVGYRWFAAKGQKPLFPFGYGLSYTRFERSGLKVSGLTASAMVANVGQRAGGEVVQLYLVSRPDGTKRRLVGFARVELAAGQKKTVEMTIDPRLLADWTGAEWSILGGEYRLALGADAEDLGPLVTVNLQARRWKDGEVGRLAALRQGVEAAASRLQGAWSQRGGRKAPNGPQ
jgi:beta-glucosidase